jgi:1,4-alpha-glucan branching enzyme
MPVPSSLAVSETPRFLGDHDLYLLAEGTHLRLWEQLGAHPTTLNGVAGTHFAVWAPDAERVSVIGDWNGWDDGANPLHTVGGSGVWAGFVPGAGKGAVYKYAIVSRYGGHRAEKADPVGFLHEVPPQTASRIWTLEYTWGDAAWLAERARRDGLAAPMAIYELHLGSWRRDPADPKRLLSYREVAPQLVEYVSQMGFTHVELLPIMEHPFYGSWGYQTTGYFAPSSRYGEPQDLMFLIDSLHQAGIGVILDWVPSHFPTDEHGLGYFDGTHLYEHGDPRQGFHPDWKSFIFNYGRNEVRAFLLSSALFWLEVYHADGLRVDGVASMLYLDYSRQPGEWIPNRHGGRENLDAMEFLRTLNTRVYEHVPGVQTIAEESTAWPMVSRPTYLGGLGFGFKWDMGWMHDTLQYFSRDPIHRTFHHNELTFRLLYAFTENFVLPLSHDEVVYGKGSLIGKMPGDTWQKLANLRLLLGYMYAQPGKKLLFMGGELGQYAEWDHERSLDWHLLDDPGHAGLQRWVRDLNTAYRGEPAFHERDCDPEGMAWIDCGDAQQSVLTWQRRARSTSDVLVVACNFTPIPRHNYRIGVPFPGYWTEILNGDAPLYGGSGQGNLGGVEALPVPWHGEYQSLLVTLPPLALVVFKGAAPA